MNTACRDAEKWWIPPTAAKIVMMFTTNDACQCHESDQYCQPWGKFWRCRRRTPSLEEMKSYEYHLSERWKVTNVTAWSSDTEKYPSRWRRIWWVPLIVVMTQWNTAIRQLWWWHSRIPPSLAKRWPVPPGMPMKMMNLEWCALEDGEVLPIMVMKATRYHLQWFRKRRNSDCLQWSIRYSPI